MAFLKLCSDDPVISELRDVFKANVLRIPEERIAPLTILVSTKESVWFLGHIKSLLNEQSLKMSDTDVKESNMATLTNRRSREVDSELGLQILSGLLTGMGGDSTPDVSANLKEAKTFSFLFPAVRRQYVEIARIGQLLVGQSFNPENLLFKSLLDSNNTVHLIDSVITSTEFEIEAGRRDESSLKIDIKHLNEMLAGTNVGVTAKGTKHLVFRSSRRLTFAFTCVNIGIADNGDIRSIAPSSAKLTPPQLADPRVQDCGHDAHVLLSRTSKLIELKSLP